MQEEPLKSNARVILKSAIILAVGSSLCPSQLSLAQDSNFREAPASATVATNPYQGKPQAAAAGQKLYGQNCAQCHGKNLQGIGPAPSLDTGSVKSAKPGELFWFITNGKLTAGMPSWSSLPKQQRWQIVTFLQTQTK